MNYSLNYTKILSSASLIAFVVALAFAGTQAFFNDEETSSGNLFTAGALDLLVDSQSHYAGLICNGQGVWEIEDGDAGTTRPDLVGDECDGTWEATDLGPTHKFFNFSDLKPGDEGENTISLHVLDNDAYACVIIDNMVDSENDCTEPEFDAEGVAYGEGSETCGDPGDGEGELSQELHFFAWDDNDDADPGNNIWDEGEQILFSNVEGPASDVIDGVVYPLFTPLTGPLAGAETTYIGLYWCYGTITVNEGPNSLECDGVGGTNLTQTDSLSADFTFYVEQARNNDQFTCPVLEEPVQRTPVGAALGAYIAPDALECDFEVSGDAELSSALADAVADDVICADDQNGVYSGPIALTTDGLTLAAVGSPVISGGVSIDAPGVTVTGFEVLPGSVEGTATAFYLKEGADGATISYNYINSLLNTGTRGIVNVIGTDLPGVTIMNNVIEGPDDGTGTGIYTNPHTGMWTISYNDIHGWLAGIGQWNGANVMNNEFSGGGEAIGVDSAWVANGGAVNFNNFLDDSRLNTYGAIAGTINAENNFFGPNGGDAQVDDQGATVDVDYDPEEVSAFPHN